MRRRAHWSRSGAAVLLAGCALLALTADGLAATEPGTATLAASAQFVTWTWFGVGDPCTPGSNLTYVAHFNGTASGGTPPYRFTWNFGDGTNTTDLENPTHVFGSGDGPWTVVLTVNDAGGSTNASSVQVFPAIFNCPAENLTIEPPFSGGPSVAPLLLDGIVVGLVAGGAASLYVLGRRRDRPGG